ncbi:MAG: hypothetical protein JW744_05565 [Candidatus Diapherotrites archaeon]|uniref:Uncharacterized protein n=1 Tax=Candidatus Iainarchaeum sp. TaxID=3101447 RepID=A0A939C7Q9_9ARCH|nr:hypothetical protein [Candidatus Diapherotrites archaeon]
MLVTVFLGVMVLALFLGNVFLSITSPKRQQPLQDVRFSQEPMPKEANGFKNPDKGLQEIAERERLRMLNKRIDRLESLLLKIGSASPVAGSLESAGLPKKLKSLEEFQQNTKLEIAALKQQLREIIPEKPKQANFEPSVDDERVHNLVYHAGKQHS